jgi:Sad1 / UNC-like C-terminal
LRLEIHSHFGNEYYCPITALKIYGSTMMEDFKESQDKERQETENQSDKQLQVIPETPVLEGPLKAILDLFKGISKLIPPTKMIDSTIEDTFDKETSDDTQHLESYTLAKNIHVQIGQCTWIPRDPFKLFRALICPKISIPVLEPASTFIRASSTPLPQPPLLTSALNIWNTIPLFLIIFLKNKQNVLTRLS